MCRGIDQSEFCCFLMSYLFLNFSRTFLNFSILPPAINADGDVDKYLHFTTHLPWLYYTLVSQFIFHLDLSFLADST